MNEPYTTDKIKNILIRVRTIQDMLSMLKVSVVPTLLSLPAPPFPPGPSADPGKTGQGQLPYPGLHVQPFHFPLNHLPLLKTHLCFP
jgi:hypothetical protein